jgi:hypothetical protein
VLESKGAAINLVVGQGVKHEGIIRVGRMAYTNELFFDGNGHIAPNADNPSLEPRINCQQPQPLPPVTGTAKLKVT